MSEAAMSDSLTLRLLARILRDGGQYTSAHGVVASLAEADKIVAGLYIDLDARTLEVKKLRKIIAAAHSFTKHALAALETPCD